MDLNRAPPKSQGKHSPPSYSLDDSPSVAHVRPGVLAAGTQGQAHRTLLGARRGPCPQQLRGGHQLQHDLLERRALLTGPREPLFPSANSSGPVYTGL